MQLLLQSLLQPLQFIRPLTIFLMLCGYLLIFAACTSAPATPLPAATPIVLAPALVPTEAATEVSAPTVATPSTETAQQASQASQETQSASSVLEQPVVALVVGVNAAFDPFESMNGEGMLVGFDIDLMNALAQAASIEVSFVDMDFDALIPAVMNNEAIPQK